MLLKRLNNKIYKALLLSILCVWIFSSCTLKTTNNTNTSNSSSSISVNFSEEDLKDEWSQEDFVSIELKGDSIESSGDGALVKDNMLTILSGGTYVISGTLNDGQILINSKDEETVRVILNGANINCSDNSPIYVVNSDKTILTLAKNTKNTLTDGKTYTLESGSDEPNAALFSKDDLTINGEGSLTVT
ncbi:carbohydrate-binding domain-containing protein, partial [Alkalibaculum bacchi]|uniref:carbohydrate-binding domain-containing protein n=1 Tax=Alkalibaculum bacchi TaxID=645887 RepID=UPI0026F10E11